MRSDKILFGLSVVGVAALHFLSSFVLLFMAGTTGGAFVKALALVLTFPFALFDGPDELSPFVFWCGWIVVSLAWGFAICSVIRRLTRRR
ncbi:MAG TPA: hypothetical protein VF681_00340 [Abditibacteriaceae bacterium]